MRVDAGLPLLFCWPHARHSSYAFHPAKQSSIAAEPLPRIPKLYEIEAEIRGRPTEQPRAVRQQRSRPETKSSRNRTRHRSESAVRFQHHREVPGQNRFHKI